MALYLAKSIRIGKGCGMVGAWGALWFCLPWQAHGQSQDFNKPPFTERITPIGTLHDGWSLVTNSAIASPDSRRVAFKVAQSVGGGRHAVTLDNLRSKSSPALHGPVFSPDSSTVAMVHMMGETGVLDIIGRPSVNVQDPVTPVVFSPDSKRTAFVAREEKLRFMVVDGERQVVAYDQVLEQSRVFSPDSKHFAFVARRGEYWFVVVNGQEGVQYQQVGNPVFSPNSQRLVYWAQKAAGNWVMVTDGQEDMLTSSKEQAGVWFSPDSTRIVAIAKRNYRWHLLVDDQFRSGHDAINTDSVRFSPDSQHLAYAAMDAGKWKVVLDGGSLDGRFEAVLEGSLKFSPDSERLAYAVQGKEGWFVVVNGMMHQPFPWIAAASMQFSPDSDRFAYVAANSVGRAVVVIDGRRWSVCHGVEDLSFTPDSVSVVWVERIGDHSRIVIDGAWGSFRFDQLVPGASLVFDSPGTFHTVVSKRPGPVFYRVEAELRSSFETPTLAPTTGPQSVKAR